MSTVSIKYKDIMSTGKDLFWKYGMKRVTVEEICNEAKVSKMTFYKYFGNKDELALAIIKQMIDNTLKEFINLMESDVPFKKKVQGTVRMKMEQSGNISKEFLSDLYTGDYPELRAYIERKTKENLDLLMNYFVKAQERGDLRKGVKIEFMMYLLNQMIAMASDEKLTSLYDTVGELVMELTNLFFYGVLPTGKE